MKTPSARPEAQEMLEPEVIRNQAAFLRNELPKKYHHFFDALCRTALVAASPGVRVPTKEMLDAAVDRFLSWPLPASVRADDCATMQGSPHRIGTNLLSGIESRQMLEHIAPLLSEYGPARLREILTLCRPAVKAWANQSAMSALNVDRGKYPPHYKPLLDAEAKRAADLLDEIDALIDAAPASQGNGDGGTHLGLEAQSDRLPFDPSPEGQMVAGNHSIGIFREGKLIAADADVYQDPHQRNGETASETPNDDMVICPNCVHQFRAIPVNVQQELATARADERERCARICEEISTNRSHRMATTHDGRVNWNHAAIECADSIRAALKPGDKRRSGG